MLPPLRSSVFSLSLFLSSTTSTQLLLQFHQSPSSSHLVSYNFISSWVSRSRVCVFDRVIGGHGGVRRDQNHYTTTVLSDGNGTFRGLFLSLYLSVLTPYTTNRFESEQLLTVVQLTDAPAAPLASARPASATARYVLCTKAHRKMWNAANTCCTIEELDTYPLRSSCGC